MATAPSAPNRMADLRDGLEEWMGWFMARYAFVGRGGNGREVGRSCRVRLCFEEQHVLRYPIMIKAAAWDSSGRLCLTAAANV